MSRAIAKIRCVVTIAVAIAFIRDLPAETPQVVVQKGHSLAIRGLAFSPDGHMIVTCSWDHTVKFWDVATGCEFRTINEDCRVNAVGFSPDGRSLALGLDDRTVAILDPVTGERTRVIAPKGVIGIGFIAFSPDGKTLALAAFQTVKLFDAHSWEELWTITSPQGITALRFSPDSSTLALAEAANGISLHETVSGKLLTHFVASARIISSLAFSPDGKRLAIAEGPGNFSHPASIGRSLNYSVILWDLIAQKQTNSLGNEVQCFDSIDFSPLGNFLVGCSISGRVVLWDVAKGEEVSFRRAEQFAASRVAFSPDGSLIIATNGSNMRIIETSSFNTLMEIVPKSVPVKKVAYDPKHRCFATASGSSVRIWSNLTGGQFRVFDAAGGVTSLQFSPDGNLLAVGTSSGPIYLEDIEHKEERRLYGHGAYVLAMAFNASGMLLATAGTDNRIILWDLRSGNEVFSSVVDKATEGTGLAYYTNSLLFASNDERLISGHGWGSTDGAIFVWDAKTGTKLSTLEEKVNRVEALAISPDGKLLISCGESDGIVMWSLDTWQKVRVIQDVSDAAAFAPDGKSFACADREGAVRIRNTDDGSIIRVLTGHIDAVSTVAYNDDGTQLCTGSDDSTSRIWDEASGQEIVSLFGIADHGYIIVTPDGYYWASKDAPDGVAFRLGDRVYSAQQFDLRLNRPDIVLQRIGLAKASLVEAYDQAHQMRLRLEGFTEEPAAGFESVPILRVTTAVDRATHDNIITLKLAAEDVHRRLLRFRVLVNGVPISDQSIPTIPADNTGRADADVQIALSAGDNRVDCSVVNSDLVESLKQTTVVTCERPVKPKLFLVTAGVSEYLDPDLRLVCAAKDAQDLANFWRGRSGDYDDVTVVSLLNQDCTKEKILETKQIFMRSGVDDEIILFFAGHGLLDSNNNYYFATYDVDKEHPEQRSLTYDAILSLLSGVESRKKLVLLDTCHAGEVEDEAYAEGVDRLFVHPGESTGTQVIASSGGTQSALEAKFPANGAFMRAVLECLKSTVARHAKAKTPIDSDLARTLSEDQKQYIKEKDARESNVTVYALDQYLAARVPKLTQGLQTPVFRSENRQNDFMIFPW